MGKLPSRRSIWLGLATLLVVAAVWVGALFLIAPVIQPGYRPAAYQPPAVAVSQPAELPDIAPIDINIATEEDFDTLPGIGPAKARAIVDDRAENGPFETVQDLARVAGISERMVEQWKDLVYAGTTEADQ